MKSRFERKSDKINKKKYAITNDIMNSLCTKRSRLKPKYLEKKLKRYANAMIKLEKKKYDIHTPVLLRTSKNPKYAGYIALPDNVKFKPNQERRGPLMPVISINVSNILPALKSKNKEDRVNGFISYMTTVHHEMRHLEQYIAAKQSKKIEDISGEEALKYAKEFVASDYCGNKYYDEKDNYRKHFTEQNARESELNSVVDILGNDSSKEQIIKEYIINGIDNTFNDAYIKTENLDYLGKSGNRDTITNELVDRAIAKYPKLLKKYPVLQKEYNKDGSRKELYQIIKDNAKSSFYIKHNPFYLKEKKQEKLEQSKNMYSSIFLASKDNLTEKNLIKTQKMVGKQAIKRMFLQSKEYLENTQSELKEFANDEEITREFLGDTRAYLKKRERNSNIQNKYAPDIEDLESGIEFYKKGGYNRGRTSLMNRVRQENKDKNRVEKNYKLKMEKFATKRMRPKEPARTLNLNEMKNLSYDYKKLKENSKNSLEMYKKDYEDLMQEKELNSEEQDRT